MKWRSADTIRYIAECLDRTEYSASNSIQSLLKETVYRAVFPSTPLHAVTHAKQVTDSVHETIQISQARQEAKQPRNAVKYAKKEANGDTTILHKNVAIHKMPHVYTSQGRNYAVRWYEYAPKNDTLESPHHVFKFFTRRYWYRLVRIRQHPRHN